MERNLDRIAAALDLIAAHLERIAAQLDPEALEKRRTAIYEQLAHELAEDPEKKGLDKLPKMC